VPIPTDRTPPWRARRSAPLTSSRSAALCALAFVIAWSRAAVAADDAVVRNPSQIAAAAGVPAPPPRVVLLAATLDDPLAGRLVAELQSLGLEVTKAAIPPTVPIEETVHAALAAGARAVVVADGQRTEFWIADDRSERVALRQELEIENSTGLESVLSLRTLELLRVSLGLAGASPGADLSAAAAAAAASGARGGGPRLRLDVSSGVVAATGRLAPFVTAGLAVTARLIGPLALEARGYAPLTTGELTDMEGRATTSIWLAGAGVALVQQQPGRLAADVGAGVLAIALHAVGTANPGGPMGGSDTTVGIGIYARVGLRVRLGRRWGLRVDVLGGSSRPLRPVIVFDQRDITPWGTAFGAATAGVEVRF